MDGMKPGIQERVAAFGPGGGLIGVLSLPSNGQSADVPHVILLNSGVIHRVGTNRLSVTLARALAAAGITNLRFDLSGIGDSERRGDAGSLRESVERDIADAIQYLQETQGTQRVVLMGLCSGAYDAFHAAVGNERVVGAVMVDMPGPFQTWRHTAYHLWSRLLLPRSWKNPLRKLDIYSRLLVRNGTTPQRDGDGYVVGGRSRAPRDRMKSQLDVVLDRGVRLYFMFTAGLESNYNHKSLFRSTFPEAARHPALSFEWFPRADHMLSEVEARSAVIDRAVQWMLSQQFSQESWREALAV
jgi:pimeloyl-ACP methyl ester carboxylesterase